MDIIYSIVNVQKIYFNANLISISIKVKTHVKIVNKNVSIVMILKLVIFVNQTTKSTKPYKNADLYLVKKESI